MTDTPSQDQKVGYGRPPTHSQFKKGTSGNPGGRPRKPKAPATELDLAELLDQPRTVRSGGKEVQVSSDEIEMRRQVEKALKEENLGSIKFVLDAFIAHGAITVPERYTTVPRFELPNNLPHDVAVAALNKYGLSPWTRKQLRPLISAYLETRDEGDRIYDTMMGYDLDV